MKLFNRLSGLLLLSLSLIAAVFVTINNIGLGITVARAAGHTVCSAGPPTCTFTNVQAAVDAASDGDVVKVAAGTYTGVNSYGGLSQVVYISKSVTIRGGYTPAFIEPPDPVANPTTLDAQGQGRVLFIAGAISPTIEGLRITGGYTLDYGGGAYISEASAKFIGNQVFSNTAVGYGGGLYVGGGSMIISNTIISNTASTGGGVLLVGGGGVISNTGHATFNNNIVSYNTASYGGGIDLASSTAVLSNNIVSYNTAHLCGGCSDGEAYGGGLLIDQESDATLINTIIVENYAEKAGSAVYVSGSSPHLLHSTIARNVGGDGSGLSVQDRFGISSSVALTNTILASHTIAISVAAGNTATLESTLWFDNIADQTGVGIITATNNYTGNPTFVDPDGGDYHLGSSSKAVDKGINAGITYDVDGNSRPKGGGYDLGAYEEEVLPQGCEAYPFALPDSVVGGLQPGTSVKIYAGEGSDKFGWLTWNPDPSKNNVAYLVEELQYPELSLNDFTDAQNSDDHSLSIGDYVSRMPGILTALSVYDELNRLRANGTPIRFVVWDYMGGIGSNGYYHINRFGLGRIDDFNLGEGWIRFTYLGEIEDPEMCRNFGLALAADQTQTGRPGESITYTHTLTNQGHYTETAVLTYTATYTDWSVNLNPVSQTLGPGQAVTVTANISVPMELSQPITNITIITARIAGKNSVSATVVDTTTVTGDSGSRQPVFLPIILRE